MKKIVHTKSGYILNVDDNNKPILPKIGEKIEKIPSIVVDPFSGICGFGIWAASFGIRFIGVELEEKFVKLSEANIALHKRAWKKLGKPIPQVLRGDSRRLSSVLSGADLILTSPPHGETNPSQSSNGINIEKQWKTYRSQGGGMSLEKFREQQGRHSLGYGSSKGQLGAMKAGDVDAVVCSPPYADSMETSGGIDPSKSKHIGGPHSQMNNSDTRYGHTPGQLGNMKSGDVDLICTSPPYAESLSSEKSGIDLSKSTFGPHSQLKTSQQYSTNPSNIGNLPAGKVENVVSMIATSPPFADSGMGIVKEAQNRQVISYGKLGHGTNKGELAGKTNYGQSPGQIGQQSGTTYWEACSEIYKQCFQILEPGGVIVLVLKSYIKGGRRVPLPMQTLKLLIHLGFEPLERIKAMLVKEEVSAGLFGEIRKVKERKSFFRRNHEFKQAAKEYWPTIPRDKRAKYIWSNRHKSKKRTRVIEIAQCAALNSYRKEGNTIGHLAKKNRIDFEEVLVCKRPK
uniref:Putative methyltransferase n=2 Tax=viral metagenome TaxID=1070528 RepID=A0A6M3XK84_9ZZZZ